MVKIDPYKTIGKPETWGAFGEGEHDEVADAERRALAEYFAGRVMKAGLEGIPHAEFMVSLIVGALVSNCGLFMAGRGVDNLADDAFENWIGMATFSWHQALEIFSNGAGHA
jgi:hypothetical protein